MFVGTIRILPLPERRADVLEILRFIQGRVLVQPEMRGLRHLRGAGPEQAVVLLERFDSEKTFLAHLHSETYGRVLGALELSRGRPDIRFERVSASEALSSSNATGFRRRGCLRRETNREGHQRRGAAGRSESEPPSPLVTGTGERN